MTAKNQRPCSKCGTSEWYVSGGCKACQRASALSCYAANPEKARAKSTARALAKPAKVKAVKAAWHQANKERILAKCAARYAANPSKAIAASRAWQVANPEARRLTKQNRRAREKGDGKKLTRGLPAKLFKLQKGKCPCCAQPLGDDYHMDHRLPLALGGSNTDDNMQLLRATCNQQKYTKHPVDFMQSRGFLL